MPAGDRTGPFGAGPRTGRAAGLCSGYSVPGYMNPYGGRGAHFGAGRGGFPWGGGRGRVWGGGRGWGWRTQFFGAIPPVYYPTIPAYSAMPNYAPTINPQDEKKILNEQISFLKEQMKFAQDRIKELEAEKNEKKKN